jgi:hypothetical protein
MHEEDVFLRYDPEEILPQAGQSGHGTRQREGSGYVTRTTERLEDEQAGNSIQGLLAASRMINSGTSHEHQLLVNQVSGLRRGTSQYALLIRLFALID